MSDRAQRIEVFNDTQDWIKNDPALSASIPVAKKNTEGVIICKTDEDLPKRMPQDDWVTVDVITIAAPDLRDKSNVHVPLVNGGTYMNNAELFRRCLSRLSSLYIAHRVEAGIMMCL